MERNDTEFIRFQKDRMQVGIQSGKVPAAHSITARSYNNYLFDIVVDIASRSASVLTVLDIGCGWGGLGRALKKSCSNLVVNGLESDEMMATVASSFYDNVSTRLLNNPIDDSDSDIIAKADIIILGDVLEHMLDPWMTLSQINRIARPESYILTSVPTITSLLSFKRMLAHGFRYKSSGVFDFTHLRFFSYSTIEEMLSLACPNRKVIHKRLLCPDSIALYQSRASDGHVSLTADTHVALSSVASGWQTDLFTRGVISLALPYH